MTDAVVRVPAELGNGRLARLVAWSSPAVAVLAVILLASAEPGSGRPVWWIYTMAPAAIIFGLFTGGLAVSMLTWLTGRRALLEIGALDGSMLAISTSLFGLVRRERVISASRPLEIRIVYSLSHADPSSKREPLPFVLIKIAQGTIRLASARVPVYPSARDFAWRAWAESATQGHCDVKVVFVDRSTPAP